VTTPDFTPAAPTTDVPDFTPLTGPPFTLYGEVYYGITELTLEDSFNYEHLSARMGDTTLETSERVEVMREIIKMLLAPDSAERFIDKLSDRRQPVGTTTINKILRYVMSEYGDRPTTPGSDSSVGSDNPESGTRSTENSSAEELMS
jgi:hypothetical protein